ncbi:hypothetical protein CB1_001430013 [Camelus ferus]|nr:hypothetical protein CB1_001430013 [Camelus ferus]
MAFVFASVHGCQGHFRMTRTIFPESLRWLMATQQFESAKKLILHFTQKNRMNPESDIKGVMPELEKELSRRPKKVCIVKVVGTRNLWKNIVVLCVNSVKDKFSITFSIVGMFASHAVGSLSVFFCAEITPTVIRTRFTWAGREACPLTVGRAPSSRALATCALTSAAQGGPSRACRQHRLHLVMGRSGGPLGGFREMMSYWYRRPVKHARLPSTRVPFAAPGVFLERPDPHKAGQLF